MPKSSYSSYGSEDEYKQEIPHFLNKEYVLLKELGHGGYAVVYLVYSIKKKKYCAIKIQDPSYYDSAKKEAKILRVISSKPRKNKKYPNEILFPLLYEVFDLELDEDRVCFCFVFELLAGSLFTLMKRGIYKHGLPSHIVIQITQQILIALCSVHESNIVHSDIKSENILIEGTNNTIEKIKEQFESLHFDGDCAKQLSALKKNKKKIDTDAILDVYENVADKIYNIINNIDEKSESDDDDKNSSEDSDSDSNFSRNLLSSSNPSDSDSDENEKSNSSNSSKHSVKKETNKEKETKCEINLTENTKVRLGDFGGSFYLDDKPKHPVQTRYFKSLETLMKCPYNEKCDIWAIGCLVYELLTGELLFDPKREQTCENILRQHIYEIQRTLGIIPNEIIKNSKRVDILFRNDGTQKEIVDFVPTLLIDRLTDQLKDKLDTETIMLFHDFIKQTLSYNQNNRLSANECLNHPLFLKQSI